jgi:hypothetical protein
MKAEAKTTEEQTRPSEPEADNFPTLEEMSGIILQARARREKKLTRLVLLLEALTVLAKRGTAMSLGYELRPLDQQQADEAQQVLDVVFNLPIFRDDNIEESPEFQARKALLARGEKAGVSVQDEQQFLYGGFDTKPFEEVVARQEAEHQASVERGRALLAEADKGNVDWTTETACKAAADWRLKEPQ